MKQGDLVFNQQTSFPSLYLETSAAIGDCVAYTGPGMAGRGADGNPLLGKVLTKEADTIGAVAIEGAGFIDVPTVGTLATGWQLLVVDGAGKAKVGANGTRVLVNIAKNGIANIKI